MTEDRREQAFADFLAAKRNRKRWLLDVELAAALDAGEHIHLLDEDGDWCLGDCEIPPRTGVRGSEIQCEIYDEVSDWDAPREESA